MDNLSCRFDGLSAHVKVLENQVASMASTSKPQGKGSGDDLDDNTEEVIKAEPEPRVYVPRMPFPNAPIIAQYKKDMYDRAAEAVKAIYESTEKVYLLENDNEFKTHYETLLAYKKWHETRLRHYQDPRPCPNLAFQPDHFAPRLVSTARPADIKIEEIADVESTSINFVEMFEPERGVMLRVKKRGDPGCFTIPCMINREPFEKCVLNLGASKSVMPLHVSREILAGGLERTNITLTLADWSTIKPAGIAQDINVTLQGHLVPTDFLIVDTKGKSDQIILSRPFLPSTGAEIKVREGLVDFRLNDFSRKVRIWRDLDLDTMVEIFNPIKDGI